MKMLSRFGSALLFVVLTLSGCGSDDLGEPPDTCQNNCESNVLDEPPESCRSHDIDTSDVTCDNAHDKFINADSPESADCYYEYHGECKSDGRI